MRVIETKVYSYDELSASAKETALDKTREQCQDIEFTQSDMLASLQGLFDKCNNITLKDYSLGEYNSYITVKIDVDNYEDFSLKRNMAWIENNLLQYIRIPFYGEKRKELRKYGNHYYAGMIKPCPFTGICYDEDFLYDLIDNIKSGMDLKSSFEALATTYQKIIQDELQSMQSEEYIRDSFIANDIEFTIDGEKI